MKLRAILSSTALVSTMAMATLATSQDASQDAVPVSSDQFGYGGKAVAETNGQLSLFGGQDENGGLYGGAPSLTIPLGDSGGLQIDGIAGVVGDEIGFAGGAAQLFYRDPQTFLVGIAGGGYYAEGESQYAVSAIAEYYLETVTLEATVGYLTGDVISDEVYGRVGLSIYPNENLRIGGGLTYYDTGDLGGDITVEALLTDVPGLALFATGAFDEAGSMGYGGVRFYFNSGSNLLDTDRAKQAAEPTLIGMHRNLGRQNFFLSDPTGFGLRQISRAGGAIKGRDPFGDIDPPPPPPPPPGTTNGGLIDTVQDTVGDLLDGTPLSQVGDLIDTLVDPVTGVLNPLTDPLNDLTNTETGPLGPVTDLVETVVDALSPVLDPLHDALSGAAAGGGGNPLEGVPVLGDVVGTLLDAAGGGLPIPGAGGGAPISGGLIDNVQNTVDGLLAGTPLAAVADGVTTLVDPVTGALAPLTGPLNDATDVASGPAAPLTQVVDALVGTENGALDPVLEGVHDLLSGQIPSLPGAGGDNPLASIPVLGDVLGSLPIPGLPGGGGTGDNPLASIPVLGDILGGLPIPALPGGGGAGDNPLASIPVLGDLLAGLPIPSGLPSAGGDNPLAGIPVVGDLVSTLMDAASGGLPIPGANGGAGDNPLAGVPVLGDLVGALSGAASGGLGGGANPLTGVPVLGDLAGTLASLPSALGGLAGGGLPLPI